MRPMLRRWIYWLTGSVFGAVMLVLGLQVLSGLDDFDLSAYEARSVSFRHQDTQISGTLHLPGVQDAPVMLLVHGDGPQDRYSGGGYLPLIKVFLESGIAVYSWDKPGVGDSQGDWLDHSMSDRADLAKAAFLQLKTLPDLSLSSFGFLGFSQAGWVLPHLAQENEPTDFLVLVGGAVDWQRQGQYYTRQRLAADGASAEAIKSELDRQASQNEQYLGPEAAYADYVAAQDTTTPMPEDRFHFVKKNWRLNSTETLKTAEKPMFIIHGSDDLNVDPDYNSQTYRQILENQHPSNRFEIIDGASHGLLRSDLFNYQRPDQIPFWVEWAFLALGREAFTPGALDLIANWVHDQSHSASVTAR